MKGGHGGGGIETLSTSCRGRTVGNGYGVVCSLWSALSHRQAKLVHVGEELTVPPDSRGAHVVCRTLQAGAWSVEFVDDLAKTSAYSNSKALTPTEQRKDLRTSSRRDSPRACRR